MEERILLELQQINAKLAQLILMIKDDRSTIISTNKSDIATDVQRRIAEARRMTEKDMPSKLTNRQI